MEYIMNPEVSPTNAKPPKKRPLLRIAGYI